MSSAAPDRSLAPEVRYAIDRITALLRRQGALPAAQPTTADRVPLPASTPKRLMNLRAAEGRRETIETCRGMRRDDPRAAGVVSTLSRDAVRGGVRVRVEDGPDAERAQQVADDLFTRLRLNHRLDDWCRLAWDDGDLFLERSVALDRDPLIVAVTRKPTLTMHRASDDTDQFADPARAFWMGETWTGEPPRDARWFAQWQIGHARWDHDEGQQYGRPLLAPARTAYTRMREGEFDVAVRRKTRAGLRWIHRLPGLNQSQVDEYKRLNQDALDDPFAALADFFTNTDGSIEAVQGDANLEEIGDIAHHIRTFALATPVPLAILGYGENINRDVLKEQQEQYRLALTEISSWVIGELIEPLVTLQWLLTGIYPPAMRYSIAPPPAEALSAETVRLAAEAAIKLKAAGLPAAFLWPIVARLIPQLDAAAVVEALVAAQALPPDDVGRLAQEAGALDGVRAARIGEILGLWRAAGRAG